jgi:hypothetical protein
MFPLAEASTVRITTYKREYNEIPIWNGVIGVGRA